MRISILVTWGIIAAVSVVGFILFTSERDDEIATSGHKHTEYPDTENTLEHVAALPVIVAVPFRGIDLVGQATPAKETQKRISVLVMDEGTSQPMPGATVYIIEGDRMGFGEIARYVVDNGVPDIAMRFGTAYPTDHAGIARVSYEQGDWIAATKDSKWGCGIDLEDDENSIAVIRIAAVTEIRLEAIHHGGAPASDARVGLWDPSGRVRFHVQTDQAGRGCVRITDEQLRAVRKCGRFVTAGFAMPLANGPLVRLDLDSLPKEPVRLILPPTGSIILEVRTAAGELFGPTGFVRLERSQSGSSDFVSSAGLSFIVNGYAEFRHVGVNLDLMAGAFRSDMSPFLTGGEFAIVNLRGPTQQGELVRAVVHLSLEYPLLVGRAVDYTGKPVQDTLIEATVTDWMEPILFRTDKAGKFRFPCPVATGEETHRVALETRPRSGNILAAILNCVITTELVEIPIGDVIFYMKHP